MLARDEVCDLCGDTRCSCLDTLLAEQAIVRIRIHGVWVPGHLADQVRAYVAAAPVGKKGWKRRATRRALWEIRYPLKAP